ncbi:DUF4157 domain-containing protein [Kitasatospora sp. NPDC097643]|uniref:eCIS core domain-containing protein n=1 Tax=Kitasatospora sp. NPDC097643 TaxID=3157230 RepID=UPI0033222363
MRGHEVEEGGPGGERPATVREADALGGAALRAAAQGRADLLDARGLLRLQRTVGNAAVGAVLAEGRSPVDEVLSSGGRPLDPEVREDMEARFGADFGDVRIHTDGAAHDSARAVGAHAYTAGTHVVFQHDAYDPGSPAGRTTLAHELTHVVQQRSGPVDGTGTEAGVRVSDPDDRFERAAVANAERVLAAEPARAAQPVQPVAGPAGPEAAVQREAVPADEAAEETEEAVPAG